MQKQQALKFVKFVVRWGIAVAGIYWVVSHMSWNDRVLALLPGDSVPQPLVLAQRAYEGSPVYYVEINGQVVKLPRADVVNEPDRAGMTVTAEGRKQVVLALDLNPDLKEARRLLLADNRQGTGAHWVAAEDVPDYHVTVPHPRVQIGVIRMVRQAKGRYLLAGLAIFPITILITSFRWNELLKALDVHLTLARTFVLNMVGLFYNSFMPGSTGGDVLKAYYVARQTHHRTRAVMSVLVDRAIGLLALIILGGCMAALQYRIPKCRQVALGSAGIVAAGIAGLVLFYVPALRRLSGLELLINRLPMQKQVKGAVETMHIFGRRWGLTLAALVMSFPVHAVVILAAMFCGIGFSLPISPFYYWMVVPVVVLAGSIPISPQGAGVMEYFAVVLLEPQGVTVAQAFALTMSIRLVQMFWNLTGGFFVLRGGYHAPTKKEQKTVEAEDEDMPHPAPVSPGV